MKLKVENFGKIKSACIELNGYSIFVGDNNSGKTYLMQLIYGVIEAVGNIRGFECSLFENIPFRVTSDNLKVFQDSVNKWLEENKGRIVKDTFNSEISIGSLSLEIEQEDVEKDYVELKKITSSEIETSKKKVQYTHSAEIDKSKDFFFCLETRDSIFVIENGHDRSLTFWRDFFVGILLESFLFDFGSKSLFIPASRTGFNLVYRDLFAAMAKSSEYNLGISTFQLPESKKMGLTKPVFDYLLFMQTYKPDEELYKKNKDIIDFIEKNIIKGKIIRNGDEIRYISNDGVSLPLFLSSSMINELTPVVHLLSSVNRVGRILYDEIETSQHPTTQIQLARLMNRLVNSGVNLVVSTHSDTMAAAISNLVALSFAKDKENKYKLLGFEKEDLLEKDLVHAYQFIKGDDGMSVVSEVEKFNELGMGFDFSLFSAASEKIFKASKVIYGDA